jgi:hypothetical protein
VTTEEMTPIKIGENNPISRSGSYSKASDALVSTAKEAINKWHPTLKRAKIGFLFRDEAPTSKGRQTWGHASKVNDRMKVYTGLDFMIWISKDIWDRLTSDRRLALIDHELCHCYMGPDGPSTIGHDVEEFTAVIERHGFWTGDLLRIESLAKGEQLKLFPEDEGGVFAVDPS